MQAQHGVMLSVICSPAGSSASQIPIKWVIKPDASLQSMPGHEEVPQCWVLTRAFVKHLQDRRMRMLLVTNSTVIVIYGDLIFCHRAQQNKCYNIKIHFPIHRKTSFPTHLFYRYWFIELYFNFTFPLLLFVQLLCGCIVWLFSK